MFANVKLGFATIKGEVRDYRFLNYGGRGEVPESSLEEIGMTPRARENWRQVTQLESRDYPIFGIRVVKVVPPCRLVTRNSTVARINFNLRELFTSVNRMDFVLQMRTNVSLLPLGVGM